MGEGRSREAEPTMKTTVKIIAFVVSAFSFYVTISLLITGSVISSFDLNRPFHKTSPNSLLLLIVVSLIIGVICALLSTNFEPNDETWG